MLRFLLCTSICLWVSHGFVQNSPFVTTTGQIQSSLENPTKLHQATTANNNYNNRILDVLLSYQPGGLTRDQLRTLRQNLPDAFTCVVTGAASGIGRALTQLFASDEFGGEVTVVALDVNGIGLESCFRSNPRVDCMVTNLAHLESVSNTVDKILTKYAKIHLLVNNAGIFYQFGDDEVDKAGQTKDGYDLCFGINYLGHFLLTEKLLRHLDSQNGRIVHVISNLHYGVDGSAMIPSSEPNTNTPAAGFGKDQSRRERHVTESYGNSKLGQIWYSAALSRRGYKSVVACPSWAATNIADEGSGASFLERYAFPIEARKSGEVVGPALTSILNAIMRTTDELGADTFNSRQMVSNARVMEKLSPLRNLWMTSKFVSPWRAQIVFAYAVFVVMVFQRFLHDEFILQDNSPESTNVRSQEALYSWSRQAVSQWLTERSAATKVSLDKDEENGGVAAVAI